MVTRVGEGSAVTGSRYQLRVGFAKVLWEWWKGKRETSKGRATAVVGHVLRARRVVRLGSLGTRLLFGKATVLDPFSKIITFCCFHLVNMFHTRVRLPFPLVSPQDHPCYV